MFRRIHAAAAAIGMAAALSAGAETAFSQTVERVSVSSAGAQGLSSSERPSVSADGRFVAFDSASSNLVPGDTNGARDVFVHDRETGETTRVSVSSTGQQGDGFSSHPSISADGRYVAFQSQSSNLVGSSVWGLDLVYVHDRETGETTRVSVNTSGVAANSASTRPSISADGRIVAFASHATNLAPGGAGIEHVYAHDRLTGETKRVSVSSTGMIANGPSFAPAVSGNGRWVAFQSLAQNLVGGDTNAAHDIFVHDLLSGMTSRLSVATGGAQANGPSGSPSISHDGLIVSFYSDATNLVAGDTNGARDIFVRNRMLGQTTRVSVSSAGAQGNNASGGPDLTNAVSSDGRFIAFRSLASNLVEGDTNGASDIFVHDRVEGQTTRVSASSTGVEGNGSSAHPAISADGRFVAFDSAANNLVPGDTNGTQDVFVHDSYICETEDVLSTSFEEFEYGVVSGQFGWTGTGEIWDSGVDGFGDKSFGIKLSSSSSSQAGLISPVFTDTIGYMALDVVIGSSGALHAISIAYSTTVNTRLIFELDGGISALQFDELTGDTFFMETSGAWTAGVVTRIAFELQCDGTLLIRQDGLIIFEGLDIRLGFAGATRGFSFFTIQHFNPTGHTYLFADNIEVRRYRHSRHHVDPNSPAPPGEQDGLSWDTAFSSLDSALEALQSSDCAGCHIWIAAGEYVPTTQLTPGDPRSATFLVPQGVQIIGGFEPGAMSFLDSSTTLNPVVLTGDLTGGAGNAYNVVTVVGDGADGPATSIERVEIRAGAADAPSGVHSRGGGVRVSDASLTLRNVLVRNCTARNGAGVSADGDAEVYLVGSAISDCTADINGGAIYSADPSSIVRLWLSQLNDNRAVTGAGGGIYAEGARVYAYRSLISRNRAAQGGGGMAASDFEAVNCTISQNKAATGAGIHILGGDEFFLHNSIVYFNEANNASGRAAQVSYAPGGSFGAPETSVLYNCIQDLDDFTDAPGTVSHGSNLDDNPIFIDYISGNFRLFAGSPCIDAGSNSLQAPRDWGVTLFDDLSTFDTGEGSAPIVDMGWREFTRDGLWIYNSLGGSMHNPPFALMPWYGGTPPVSELGHGVFKIDNAYTVTPTTNFTTGKFTFVRGDVTIDASGPHTVSLISYEDSLDIGFWAGEDATARIKGGLSAPAITLGRDPGSFGTLRIEEGAALDSDLVYISSGRFHLAPASSASSDVIIMNQGSVSGFGSIVASNSVDNFGVVSPGDEMSRGALTLDMVNYVQDGSGALVIDIDGSASSDQLIIDGAGAYLDGALIVNFINGYAPAVGASFDIVTVVNSMVGVEGAFSVVYATGLPDGLGVETLYPGDGRGAGESVTIMVVATSSPQIDLDDAELFELPGVPSAGALADFNGDGLPDLAVAIPDGDDPENSPGVVAVLLNQGSTGGEWNGFALEAVYPVGKNPVAIVAADFNNGNGPDVIVANKADDTLSILSNLGESDGWLGLAEKSQISVVKAPRDLLAADFDGDGDIDLAVTGLSEEGDGVLVILHNQFYGARSRSTSFYTAQVFPVGLDAGAIGAAESDTMNRGLPALDLFVADPSAGRIAYFANDEGSGLFSDQGRIHVGAGPGDIASGDLNGDGLTDIVVTNRAAGTISIIARDGEGGFSQPVTLPVGAMPTSVALADIDGAGGDSDDDPSLDILVVAQNSEGRPVLKLIRNIRGEEIRLAFAPAIELDAGSWPVQALTGDLNDDGTIDLVAVNADPDPMAQQDDGVAVILNVTSPVKLGDLNGDGFVGAADLGIMLGSWGACPDPPAECPADLNGDGLVGSADLAILLGNWG